MHNVEWLQLLIKTWQLMSGFRIFKEFVTSLPVKLMILQKEILIFQKNASNNKEMQQDF